MSFIALVPARMASTRLPGKPLLDVAGLPLVVRTLRQALRSGASRVLVATDDTQIAETVEAHGHEAMLTRTDHLTGTDRLAEVVTRLSLDPDDIVVNVQGDEPLIDPALIDQVAARLQQSPDAAIATCAAPIADVHTLFDPNAVKVVCSLDGRALYFSRAPVPWSRDALADGQRRLANGLPALHHIGLYAYRAGFLRSYPQLPSGPLERHEALEQLRAMENGLSIVVSQVARPPAAGVDTPEDLARVREFLNSPTA